MTAIFFSRAIGPVALDVVVSEKHIAELEITLNPVEASASVTDHAYPQPKILILDVADGNAALTWQALVRFQESRIPFSIVTGLDYYRNMLIKRLEADRDERFSQVLRCKCELQEVILVSSAHVPGGNGKLSGEKAGDQVTKDRISGTVQRGDSAMGIGTGARTAAGGAASLESAAASARERTMMQTLFGSGR